MREFLLFADLWIVGAALFCGWAVVAYAAATIVRQFRVGPGDAGDGTLR